MPLYVSCLFLACLLGKPSLSLPLPTDYNLIPSRSLRDQSGIPYPSNEMLRDAIKRVPELDQVMYNTLFPPAMNQRLQQQQKQQQEHVGNAPSFNKGMLPKFILEAGRIQRRRSPSSPSGGGSSNADNSAVAQWISKLTSNQTYRHKKDGGETWPMALDEFVDQAKKRQWYVENGVDTRFPLPERRKFPEVDWRGFNEDVFHESFGDFTPMKRQSLRWR